MMCTIRLDETGKVSYFAAGFWKPAQFHSRNVSIKVQKPSQTKISALKVTEYHRFHASVHSCMEYG